jgi:subtilisin family serine protease
MTLRRPFSTLALTAALVTLLVVLGVSGAPFASAQTAGDPPYAAPVKTLDEALRTGRIRKETLDAVRQNDTAPVLVRVRLPSPFRPEGELTGAQVEQQRQAIAAAQTAILNKIAGRNFSDVRRFRTIPSMGLTADEATLTALVAMPEVLRIGVDALEEPYLATSTTVIGSAMVRNALGNPGAGWTIAILDTGVDKNHPFLAGKVVSEACYSDDFCPNGSSSTAAGSGLPCNVSTCDHGTHVAGIAAGRRFSNSTTTVAFDGVASEAGIIAVQIASRSTNCPTGVTSPCTRIRVSDRLRGMERVYDLRTTFQIAAVNLSLGGQARYTSQAECDDDNQDSRDIIDNLRAANIATVVASGNGALAGTQFTLGIARPACISGVISVGATTNLDAIRASSQTASFLTLLAPGNLINSSVTGGGFGTKSGTSMAAPHVAGAFAVLRALEPGRSVTEIRDTLITTGKPITDSRLSPAVTTARIQLDGAVEARQGKPLRPTNVQVTNVTGTSMQVGWTDNSRSEAQFRVTATPDGNSIDLFPKRATVNAGVTSTPVSGLHPATRYTVTVRACNASGKCSPDSDPVVLTTVNTLPCTPLNFRAGTVTMTSIAVQWDLCPSSNPLTEFRVRTNASGSGSQITRTYGPGVRGDTFSGLSSGTRYYFYVRACNNDGCSPESSMLSVLTPAPPPPAAPSNLHLCGGQELCLADHVTLIWDDNSGNETNFVFEWDRAQVGTQPFTGAENRVTLEGANIEGYSISNSDLSSGGQYYFRVKACNAGGCSTYSNRVGPYTAP